MTHSTPSFGRNRVFQDDSDVRAAARLAVAIRADFGRALGAPRVIRVTRYDSY